MKRNRMIISVLLMLFVFSGCATVTTMLWPEVEKEVVGDETIVGETIGHDYEVDVKGKGFNVKSIPFCREKAPKYKITKKQHHGIVFIIIETPVWGLGLADWALSYMVSENSIEKELVEYIPTGVKKSCGGEISPAHGKIMIQNSATGEIKWTKTDENGNFSLINALGEYKGTRSWNLFFENEDNEKKYLTTVWW